MNEIRVEGWRELQDALFGGSWNADLGRFRSPFAFRGVSDAKYDLRTALMRLGGDFVSLERHLLRNFRKYAHRDMLERDSFWHTLAAAQHHGLPTRLLDWTYSPFVALHFVSADLQRTERDGAIWMVNFVEAKALLPDVLQASLAEEGADVFTVEMLTALDRQIERDRWASGNDDEERAREATQVRSLELFDSLSDEDFLFFFEPPSLDDRIVNQFALFSIISNPRTGLDEWLQRHPNLYTKVVIPADLKWEVRDKLDQGNITERVLFPGLDGLAAWLKRHYSPRYARSETTPAPDPGHPDADEES